MKARLINDENGLQILHSNGIIKPADTADLYNLLVNFKSISVVAKNENGVGLSNWNESCCDMALYPGETLAYVTDELHLAIVEFEPFKRLFYTGNSILDDLVTVSEYACLHKKSNEQVKVFCRDGRIPGAKKVGRDWLIPKDAPYPVDRRYSNFK